MASAVQRAIGALGVFASVLGGLSGLVGYGVIRPLLAVAFVMLLSFIVSELLLVRPDSRPDVSRTARRLHPRGRSLAGRTMADPRPVLSTVHFDTVHDIAALLCRVHGHVYRPRGITTDDRLGLTARPQPPRMVWVCSLCGDERWLTPGLSPE